MERYFYELNPENFIGKTIVLDVDGTIISDGAFEVRPDVAQTLRKMASRNKIFLCSNSIGQNRLQGLAVNLGVTALEKSGSVKPSRKVLKHLSGVPKEALVIIGDKWLTDGLLALRSGASFIKVKRLVAGKERFSVKAANMLDDTVYAFLKHWPFFVAALVYLAISGAIVLMVLSATEGRLAYAFDDVYIHMAIAKNLALNKVWGINAGEFSSSSSSIIYPLILAASFLVFGINELTPLLINLIFGVLSILAAYLILKKFGLSHIFISLILLFFIFTVPLFLVSFTGLEHTIHIALALVFVYLAARVIALDNVTKKEIIFLMVLAPLLVSVRYESMFLLFVVCALFFIKKRWGLAFWLGLLGMAPVLIFGIFSLWQGSYFFPNPLLLKAKYEHFAFWDLLKLGYYGLKNMTESHILLLVAGALSLVALGQRKSQILKDSLQVMLIVFTASTFLHLAFAQTGWGHRYEAYLVAIGIVSLAIGYKKYFASPFNFRPILSVWTLVFFVLFLPFIFRASSVLITAPAMVNVYEQHYQMGLFLKKYYEKQTVLANDIGAVSFLPNAKIIDFVGLGNFEVTKARRSGNFTKEWLDAYLKEQNSKIAIVHDSWFWDFGVPSGWTKVGTWTITGNIPFAARTVTFYALTESEVKNLRRNFEEFSELELPQSVITEKYF